MLYNVIQHAASSGINKFALADPAYALSQALAVVVAAGLVVNKLEPGIFEKDKGLEGHQEVYQGPHEARKPHSVRERIPRESSAASHPAESVRVRSLISAFATDRETLGVFFGSAVGTLPLASTLGSSSSSTSPRPAPPRGVGDAHARARRPGRAGARAPGRACPSARHAVSGARHPSAAQIATGPRMRRVGAERRREPGDRRGGARRLRRRVADSVARVVDRVRAERRERVRGVRRRARRDPEVVQPERPGGDVVSRRRPIGTRGPPLPTAATRRPDRCYPHFISVAKRARVLLARLSPRRGGWTARAPCSRRAPACASRRAARTSSAAAAAPGKVAVLCHGYLGSRFDLVDLAEALAREGFLVLAPEFAETLASPETTPAYARPPFPAAGEPVGDGDSLFSSLRAFAPGSSRRRASGSDERRSPRFTIAGQIRGRVHGDERARAVRRARGHRRVQTAAAPSRSGHAALLRDPLAGGGKRRRAA